MAAHGHGEEVVATPLRVECSSCQLVLHVNSEMSELLERMEDSDSWEEEEETPFGNWLVGNSL